MRGLKTLGISLVLLTEVGCQSRYFRTNLAGRNYPADYDRNGDGITDIQAIRAGFDPADPTLATQDPDGDGLTNYWEFKLGFNPNKADSDNTKYDKKIGGNGTGDCDEDLVGDGIGVCWKLNNKFKPAEGNRSLTDADGDAYSDGEEFVASTDPNDATKRPAGGTAGSDGKLPPVLTLKGTNSSYTTSLSINGTMSYCAAGEKVLFTSSKTKPSVDDAGFVDCTTSADALVGTLASGPAGNRVMFVWRKITAGVVDVPLSAGILYTNRAAGGGLDVIPVGDKTLAVALVPPADAQYGTVKLLRFSELDCSTKTEASTGATEVSVNPGDTLVTAANLPLGSSYCFKVFWKDDKGSVITAHGGYDGTPPPAGTISISGYETKTIKFSHTPPTSAKYEKLVLRRFESLTCADKLASEGTEVPMGMTATAYSDTNLPYGTPYCYKVFWSDTLGNNNSATVGYPGPPTGADLVLLGMQKTGANTGSVDLRLTRPIPEPTQTTLIRYGDSTCTSAETPNVTLTSPMPATYDKTDSVTGFKTYCYKATWSDDFGNSATDSVVAKLYPPVISISPIAFTYTAPGSGTAVTANSAGTVTYTASSFSSIFTNSSATITPLLGNGSGSILAGSAASLAESDIPGLTYSTANGCGTSTATVFCTTANLSGTVTGTSYSLVNTGILKWIYSKFDQGEYFVKTMGRLDLDGTKYYSLPSDGVIRVQTPDLGNEEVLFSDTSNKINDLFSNPISWGRFSPSVAVATNISDPTKEYLGITYSAFNLTKTQYFNIFSITHDASVATPVESGFSSTPLADANRIAANSAETAHSSIVAAGSSDASDFSWLSLSTVAATAPNKPFLQLTALKKSANSISADSAVRIPLTSSSTSIEFGNSKITQAFSDKSDGTARHGVVFSALNASTYGIYISKIRSSPLPSSPPTKDSFIDTYTSNSTLEAFPKSVPVKTGLSSEPDDLKIVTATESGSTFFYTGWRVIDDTKLYFAKLSADGSSTPTVFLTKNGNEISGMDIPNQDDEWGRSSYGIAAGMSNDNTPVSILGVVYSASTADLDGKYKCRFRAYKITSTELERIGNQDLDIGTSTDSLTTSSDCRFANLFWNAEAKKFMAVWVQGLLDPTGMRTYFGPTYYSEFKFSTDNTIQSFKRVDVTKDRSAQTNNLVCNIGVSFNPSTNGTTIPRLAIATIESSVCKQSTADLKIDFFKPGN